MNAPSQHELDSSFGYIYNIVGPGGRIYVGKRIHPIGEPWGFYTGSGLRLRDEACWLEPTAFEDPSVRIEGLTRKRGTRLRYYRKYLSSFAADADELRAKELSSIEALVTSGRPFYNLEDAELFASRHETRRAMLAFRFSFEPRLLESLDRSLADVTTSLSLPHSFGTFSMQHDALLEARRIRTARASFRRHPQRGLTF